MSARRQAARSTRRGKGTHAGPVMREPRPLPSAPRPAMAPSAGHEGTEIAPRRALAAVLRPEIPEFGQSVRRPSPRGAEGDSGPIPTCPVCRWPLIRRRTGTMSYEQDCAPTCARQRKRAQWRQRYGARVPHAGPAVGAHSCLACRRVVRGAWRSRVGTPLLTSGNCGECGRGLSEAAVALERDLARPTDAGAPVQARRSATPRRAVAVLV